MFTLLLYHFPDSYIYLDCSIFVYTTKYREEVPNIQLSDYMWSVKAILVAHHHLQNHFEKENSECSVLPVY